MSEVDNKETVEQVKEPVEEVVEIKEEIIKPKKKVERQKKIRKVKQPKKEIKKEADTEPKKDFFFPKINEDLAFMTAGIFSAGAMIYLFTLTKNPPQQLENSQQQETILSKPPPISEEQPKPSKPSFNFV